MSRTRSPFYASRSWQFWPSSSPAAKRPPSRNSQLRAITGEIVAAAQKVTGHKSEITVTADAAPAAALPSDTIYVSLGRSIAGTRLAARACGNRAAPQALRSWKLSSGGVDRFDFTFAEFARIRSAWSRRCRRAHSFRGSAALEPQPALAIIIDDLGNDRFAGDAVIALPFPLTVSVLPHLPFSAEIAEEAYRRGDQVLLHLPMQAESA